MTGAIAVGLAGGIIAGLLGVGGGVLFVPGLVLFLGLDQHHAEATSLLAIVPVAIVGTIRQDRYGNVNVADALEIGLPAVLGVLIGTWLQQRLQAGVISLLFAAVLVASAVELVLR